MPNNSNFYDVLLALIAKNPNWASTVVLLSLACVVSIVVVAVAFFVYQLGRGISKWRSIQVDLEDFKLRLSQNSAKTKEGSDTS